MTVLSTSPSLGTRMVFTSEVGAWESWKYSEKMRRSRERGCSSSSRPEGGCRQAAFAAAVFPRTAGQRTDSSFLKKGLVVVVTSTEAHTMVGT